MASCRDRWTRIGLLPERHVTYRHPHPSDPGAAGSANAEPRRHHGNGPKIVALLLIKTFLALPVLLAGLLGGSLALRSGRSGRLAGHLGHANAFASGIILGTGLLHMLPDAHEILHEIYPSYPVAFLLAAAAFLLLLLVEHVLLGQRGHSHGELARHGQHELASEVAVHAADHRLASFVLLAGLSVHSILSGVALGAQNEASSTAAILVALILHKATEGFALGVSLTRNRVEPHLSWWLLLGFAAATPLGIAAGAVATQYLHADFALAFEGVFSAAAAGTFIYIASLDMIGEEFSHGDRPFAKWLSALVGLALAAALAWH
jgi:solute carrier family 39 (zinc transporter), member 1/2/3